MQLLIKNAILIDPASKLNGEKVSISIKKGQIRKIGKRLSADKAKIYDAKGAYLCLGFLDVGTLVGDPGFEHREDFKSIEKAALAGGYTSLACLPNTHPAIHSKSEVLYAKSRSGKSAVSFLPIGAVSENCEGKDITEMYDMRMAGAVAFSDGKNPVQDSGMMMRSLQYVQPFNGVIINQPLDLNVAQNGQLHEGVISTSLGLRGVPGMAEELIVQRDIYLSEYTDSNLHLLNISTAESVRLVRLAKKKGLKVTASVAALNLAYTDEALSDFNSLFKVSPPLRSEKDRKALIDGVKDGTIDCITSNHTPLEAESKNLEFLYAKPGAIGLQTTFSTVCQAFKGRLTPELLAQKLAYGPRQVLGLEVPTLEEGAKANFTIFNLTNEWVYQQQMIQSKSRNTPFEGQVLKGTIQAVVSGKKLIQTGL